jgi:tetratricopeptide (TPR) repeat protein
MRILNFTINFLLVVALMISGCSPVSKGVPPQGDGEDVAVTLPDEEVRNQLHRYLEEGDLLEAHRFLRDARADGIKEQFLFDLYEELGNQLLAEAQKDQTAGRFASAGRFYRLSLEVYPEDEQHQLQLIMPRSEISARLEECADSLMKSGLAVYRAGALEDAINIWKRIREFHPEHAPSGVAISTAEKQLDSLEKLAPGKAM